MNNFLNENEIQKILVSKMREDRSRVTEILTKARNLVGLDLAEAAYLAKIQNPDLLQEIFLAAGQVKQEIYGKRLVIFAPLYISNLCSNECLYCAFRATNKSLKRSFLNQEQIAKETKLLIDGGHKRILLVSGEAYPQDNLQYVLGAIQTIYATKSDAGEIRRINVNIAPLSVDDFKQLKAQAIGTYQLFQETYHRDTYRKVHLLGKKSDYDWRISAFDRAISAGIDDVGLGVLFGLYDWRFEMLALLRHASYLQDNFGAGPHTISVPRLEPAFGSELASKPPFAVSDIDFCKIVAILRLAVPYTGIIMSTREDLAMRRKTLELGVSQISAGSRTNPGGYSNDSFTDDSQFALGDHRSLDEVVRDVASLGYMPSFCTACYRLGRTGEDFMLLAKHGHIKEMCAPNAIATFAEYLNNYGSSETVRVGNQLIQKELDQMPENLRLVTDKLLKQIAIGKRDVFV